MNSLKKNSELENKSLIEQIKTISLKYMNEHQFQIFVCVKYSFCALSKVFYVGVARIKSELSNAEYRQK